MNSGIAIRANELMPSNKASPNSDSGSVPVKYSMAAEPSPSTTHTGTARTNNTAIAISGP